VKFRFSRRTKYAFKTLFLVTPSHRKPFDAFKTQFTQRIRRTMIMIGSYLGRYGFGMMSRYGETLGMGLGMVGLGFSVMGVLGLIFGVVVIFAAIMLNSKPEQHTMWGSLIVLFSVLSIFGSAMGFGIGLILALIGGILALTWKPARQ
jgi:hypothetical protein